MAGTISSSSDIALSGLLAAQTQVSVAATNIANSQSDGTPIVSSAPFGSSAVAAPPLTGTQPSAATSQVFQALQAVQTDQAGGGTNVSVRRSAEVSVAYQPDSPLADSQGLVATPNVNPVQQAVELTTAANVFAANAVSLHASNQISKRVLDLTT